MLESRTRAFWVHIYEVPKASVEEREDVGNTERWKEARSHGVLGAKASGFGFYYQAMGDHWGLHSVVASCHSRSSPLGLSCLIGLIRTDSRNIMYISQSLLLESTCSPWLPSSPSLLPLHNSSGVLTSGYASCLLYRSNSSVSSSALDTRGSTSLVSFIGCTATPGVKCYKPLEEQKLQKLRYWQEVPGPMIQLEI